MAGPGIGGGGLSAGNLGPNAALLVREATGGATSNPNKMALGLEELTGPRSFSQGSVWTRPARSTPSQTPLPFLASLTKLQGAFRTGGMDTGLKTLTESV